MPYKFDPNEKCRSCGGKLLVDDSEPHGSVETNVILPFSGKVGVERSDGALVCQKCDEKVRNHITYLDTPKF